MLLINLNVSQIRIFVITVEGIDTFTVIYLVIHNIVFVL